MNSVSIRDSPVRSIGKEWGDRKGKKTNVMIRLPSKDCNTLYQFPITDTKRRLNISYLKDSLIWFNVGGQQGWKM